MSKVQVSNRVERTLSVGLRRAFTLVEVIMVILLISVLSAIILPSMNPSVYNQLQAAGEVVVNDLAAGRSLAVTNSSTYSFTFDLPNNQYYLQYSGSNSALSTLPSSPFYSGAGHAHPAVHEPDLPADAFGPRVAGGGGQ